MRKNLFFIKNTKNYNLIIIFIFLFIIIIYFTSYYININKKNFVIYEPDNFTYFIIPYDKEGEKVKFINKKSINNKVSTNQNDLNLSNIEKLELDHNWIKNQEDESKWEQLTQEISAKFLTKTRNEWANIFCDTDACVEPVLNFNEVESNLQNQSRDIFFRKNNILQANIAPKFSRSVPKSQLNENSLLKTTNQIIKEWGID